MSDALELIGLSHTEAQLYRAMLPLGNTTVNRISLQAQMHRPTTYDVLEKLAKKGFVTTNTQDGKKHYAAISPKELLAILKEKEIAFKKELPKLNAQRREIVEPPRTETFVGRSGMKILFERILEETQSFYCIASNKQLSVVFKYYLPSFVKRRIKKGISVKILTDSQPLDKNAPYKRIHGTIKTATWIYPNTIILASLDQKEPVAMLIKEKNIFETQKLIFETLWNTLP